MIESALSAQPEPSPVVSRTLVLTQVIGIAVVVVLALVVYAWAFYRAVPSWIALTAFAAQSWAVSSLIGRVRRLRNRGQGCAQIPPIVLPRKGQSFGRDEF